MFCFKTQTGSLFEVITCQNSKVEEDGGHDSGHGRFSGARGSSKDEVTKVRRLRAFHFHHLDEVEQLGQLLLDSPHPVHEKKKLRSIQWDNKFKKK
jgi:hypothetical protein